MTPTELEKTTGIDRMRWSNVKRKSIRATGEHLEAAGKLWPEYAYWLITGNARPEHGDISPEIEDARKKLHEVG